MQAADLPPLPVHYGFRCYSCAKEWEDTAYESDCPACGTTNTACATNPNSDHGAEPPLPEPALLLGPRGVLVVGERPANSKIGFTAEQMRSYGQACAREAREQAARICDEINTESGGGFEPFAAAIREGMK